MFKPYVTMYVYMNAGVNKMLTVEFFYFGMEILRVKLLQTADMIVKARQCLIVARALHYGLW